MINPGTLVLTWDGHYAIVLSVPNHKGDVRIFTSYGLHSTEHEDDLTPLGLKRDSTEADPPAFFGEIIAEKAKGGRRKDEEIR